MATVRPRIKIGPADAGRRMTLDEFRDADVEPGFSYELARGVLVVTEVPNDPHAKIVDNLHEALSDYRRRHPGLIWRIGHGSDVRLVIPEAESDRHPDLALIFEGAPRDDRGRRQPDLVVEVVSPGAESRRRDLVEKVEDDLAFGIREDWIVDPERQEVAILSRDPAGPSAWARRVVRGDGRIVSALLPGFETPSAALCEGLDAEG